MADSRPCAVCGEVFVAVRRDAKYCGRRCSKRAQNDKPSQRAALARWRQRNPDYDRRHDVRCENCGIAAKVTTSKARFCSFTCANRSRRRTPSTALELWRPSAIQVPSKRWQRPPSKHRSLEGTCFVFGRCSWCEDSFMALATAYPQRSLYCSKRCGRNAGKSRRGRFNPPPSQRRRIYERDGWTCQLCKEPVDPNATDIWRATLDHIVPQSHQLIPDHSDGNMRLTHLWCNAVRGDGRYNADFFEEVA